MTTLVTDNLPLLANAPNGIKRIRALILELAVTGRLVEQDPAEEPVEKLIGRISAFKEAEIAAGRLKRQKALELATDAPENRIPTTWRFVHLGDVVEIVRGITFPASEKSKEPGPGKIACLRTANVQDEIEWDDLLFVRESFVGRADQYLQPRDIVMSMANSRELVGKVALVGEHLSQRSTFGGFLGVLRPYLIEPRYVMALLRTPRARAALIDSASQTTNIANVSLGKLRPLTVALPPLEEQHRIVAKVDELMALCDRLEAEQADAEAAHAKLVEALLASLTQARNAADFRASWQQLAEHFHTLFTTEASVDALKQTVMQLGVEGRLCASAAHSTWRLRTINEFCTVQGGIQKTPLRAPARHHFPYLRVANVQRGRIDVAQLERYELAPEELQRWRLNAGDLLIVEGNGSESEIGRCAIWRGEVDDCVYQNHLMRVRPTGDDAVEYLALYLNSPVGTAHMRRLAITTSGLFNLSVGKIRSIPVELPAPAEQRRIVAKVDELLGLCNVLKRELVQARERHAQVATVLVKHAEAAA